jgi:hypothetical protein
VAKSRKAFIDYGDLRRAAAYVEQQCSPGAGEQGERVTNGDLQVLALWVCSKASGGQVRGDAHTLRQLQDRLCTAPSVSSPTPDLASVVPFLAKAVPF